MRPLRGGGPPLSGVRQDRPIDKLAYFTRGDRDGDTDTETLVPTFAARLPEANEVGLVALERHEADGITYQDDGRVTRH